MAKKEYVEDKSYGKVRVVRNADYKWGVLDTEGNVVVPFGKYGWIDGFDRGLARVRTRGWILVGSPVSLSELFKDDFERITSAEVQNYSIINEETGEVIEKTRMCLFLEEGVNMYFDLGVDSVLEDGDKVDVRSVTLQKLEKDGVTIYNADGDIEGAEYKEDNLEKGETGSARQREVYVLWGVIDEKGNEVIPLKCDSIWNFKRKKSDTIVVERGADQWKVSISDLHCGNYFDPDYPEFIEDEDIYDEDYYDDTDYAKDTWDAMTDGMYDDDLPGEFGYDVDYESMGF